MTPFTLEHPLRLVELFAGIGAQAAALERMGVPYTSVVAEIDDKAYAAYCAIHGPVPNLGDVSKIERLPECDLLTYSFPCQDLSVAGHRKGMEKGSGTRSSLLWEVGRLLEASPKPKWLVMENVPAILHKTNRPAFDAWIGELSRMGYASAYKVLDARDYGIPQHRERCIMVSVLGGPAYRFPEPPGRGGGQVAGPDGGAPGPVPLFERRYRQDVRGQAQGRVRIHRGPRPPGIPRGDKQGMGRGGGVPDPPGASRPRDGQGWGPGGGQHGRGADTVPLQDPRPGDGPGHVRADDMQGPLARPEDTGGGAMRCRSPGPNMAGRLSSRSYDVTSAVYDPDTYAPTIRHRSSPPIVLEDGE